MHQRAGGASARLDHRGWHDLSNDLKNIDKIRSEVGMCFQHFNLFPHLTILENCTLAPIWVRKTPKKEAEETAMHFLEKVKIPEQADKYPGQLSGGQQQRVAIARSSACGPGSCCSTSRHRRWIRR
jgi:general L-amino acid transport system ATP-binding protein